MFRMHVRRDAVRRWVFDSADNCIDLSIVIVETTFVDDFSVRELLCHTKQTKGPLFLITPSEFLQRVNRRDPLSFNMPLKPCLFRRLNEYDADVRKMIPNQFYFLNCAEPSDYEPSFELLPIEFEYLSGNHIGTVGFECFFRRDEWLWIVDSQFIFYQSQYAARLHEAQTMLVVRILAECCLARTRMSHNH